MESLLTAGNITFAIGIIAIIFTIYNKFHKPQEALETKQLLADKELSNKATILAQKELETKALVLAEQVKAKNEETERRFNEMGMRLDNTTLMAQKEIHEIDKRLEVFINSQNIRNEEISNSLIKLFTILEERLPKILNK